MTVKVNFICDGCFKEAEGTRYLRREFKAYNDNGWGYGQYIYDTPQKVAPDGWVAFDPYTGCCYCPDCWEAIEKSSDDDQQNIEQA